MQADYRWYYHKKNVIFTTELVEKKMYEISNLKERQSPHYIIETNGFTFTSNRTYSDKRLLFEMTAHTANFTLQHFSLFMCTKKFLTGICWTEVISSELTMIKSSHIFCIGVFFHHWGYWVFEKIVLLFHFQNSTTWFHSTKKNAYNQKVI